MRPPNPDDLPVVDAIHVVKLKPVAPSLEEIVRLLGHRSQRPIGPALETKIRLITEVSQNLSHPRGIYGIWSRESLSHCPLPPKWGSDIQQIALCAVTIGDELETQATTLSRELSLSKAVILDACGSAIVEAAADMLDARICQDVLALGQSDGRRRSPGYGNWPIVAQKTLIEILDAARIGIVLTEGMAMIPKKSISFAKPIGTSPGSHPPISRKRKCEHCDLKHCPYRETTGDSP